MVEMSVQESPQTSSPASPGSEVGADNSSVGSGGLADSSEKSFALNDDVMWASDLDEVAVPPETPQPDPSAQPSEGEAPKPAPQAQPAQEQRPPAAPQQPAAQAPAQAAPPVQQAAQPAPPQ